MAHSPGKACCSCTCAISDDRYTFAVVPDGPNEGSNSTIRLRPVATADAPSFTSCICYYNDERYTWTQVPVPDPSGSKRLRFVFRRVRAPNSSKQPACYCYFNDERYTVTKVQDPKSDNGQFLTYKRVPKADFTPRICCSCLCSYCCLCCYGGTQYENPVSQLPADPSEKACCSTSSAFQSSSRQTTASISEEAKIASQVGAAFPRAKPVPPPKEKTSLSTSRLHTSSLPVKRRLGSQLAANSHAEKSAPAKRPRILDNSNENSSFGASGIGQRLPRQKTTSFPEKTKLASQVGAVFPQTKTTLEPKCQELKLNPKEKASLSASNSFETSSRQQTSSLSGKRMMEKELSSPAGPEPMPPTKQPRLSVKARKLEFHRDEKWVKNLRRLLKLRKQHGMR